MDRPDGIFFKKFICNGKGKMEWIIFSTRPLVSGG
jgi:hypothetical protein